MAVGVGVEEEVEGDVDVVDSGVGLVDEVAEVDGKGARLGEEGGVAGDVLFDGPEDAGGAGLGGAAAEELDAVEPDAEDAVELAAAAGSGPLKDDGGGGAVEGAVGGGLVGGGDGGLGVGGAEVVLEDEGGAGFGLGERDGSGDLEVGGGGGLGVCA